MRDLIKNFTLLALLISLSLPVLADTSNDTTHARDEVKQREVNDGLVPQQGSSPRCRYGCCGSYAFGTCSTCCPRPQAMEAEIEANNTVIESHQRFGNNTVMEHPQKFGNNTLVDSVQRFGNNSVIEPYQAVGSCSHGCCSPRRLGLCRCCLAPQTVEARAKVEAEANNTIIEPQQRFNNNTIMKPRQRPGNNSVIELRQRFSNNSVIGPQQWSGNCKNGCCSSRKGGLCICCLGPQATDAQAKVEVEANNTVTELQQRFGNNTVMESPQRFGNNTIQRFDNNTILEPYQVPGSCSHGCCSPRRLGLCRCCLAPQTVEAQTKAEAEINNTVIEPQQKRGHWSPNCDNGCHCRYHLAGRCICCSPGRNG